MQRKIQVSLKGILLFGLVAAIWQVTAQEIDWYSVDNGGGVSAAGDVSITGVVGQTDVLKMEGDSVTIAGGYLPLSADLIFENPFD